MTLKVLTVEFQSLEDGLEELGRAIENDETLIQSEDYLYFDSRKDFRKDMSLHRIEILSVISSNSPGSVYELAKMLEREQPNVQKDCRFLEFLGFLHLVDSGNSRRSKIPRLIFNYDCILLKGDHRIPDRYIQISPKAQEHMEKAI